MYYANELTKYQHYLKKKAVAGLTMVKSMVLRYNTVQNLTTTTRMFPYACSKKDNKTDD